MIKTYLIKQGFVILILLTLATMVGAQSESKKSLEKARIFLSYKNINNTGPRLTATVKARKDRIYEPVEGMNLDFYVWQQDEKVKMGSMQTNSKGECLFDLPETLRKPIDTLYSMTYLVEMESQNGYKKARKEIEIRRSKVQLVTEVVDSIKKVSIVIFTIDSSGTEIPVADLEPTINVERMFGMLRISEEFEMTDEDGKLEIDFPADIPGNKAGDLKIIAHLDDHDEFGTLIASKTVEWGVPLNNGNEHLQRELWSAGSNAPYYLVITVIILVFGIWSIIGYLIWSIFKIKSLGQELE